MVSPGVFLYTYTLNIQIYSEIRVIKYNLDSKLKQTGLFSIQIHLSHLRGDYRPFLVSKTILQLIKKLLINMNLYQKIYANHLVLHEKSFT